MNEGTVIVERSFGEATSFDVLQAEEKSVAWCSAQRSVVLLRSYLSLDGRTMIGAYRAPEVDAVRQVQRRAGIPVTRAWEAQLIGSPERRAAKGFATVVVEREFSEGFTLVQIQEMLRIGRRCGCLEANRCEPLHSNLSIDRKRMVCVYQAPDAESVRQANRVMGLPASRVWTAQVHHE